MLVVIAPQKMMIGAKVDVKIGVANAPREIAFDVDMTQEEVIEKITKSASDEGFVTFIDTKDTTWFLKTETILYVEFGKATGRKVGFVS